MLKVENDNHFLFEIRGLTLIYWWREFGSMELEGPNDPSSCCFCLSLVFFPFMVRSCRRLQEGAFSPSFLHAQSAFFSSNDVFLVLFMDPSLIYCQLIVSITNPCQLTVCYKKVLEQSSLLIHEICLHACPNILFCTDQGR